MLNSKICSRQEKTNIIKTGKKFSLFIDDVILYVENSKKSTKNISLLNLITEFIEVAKYKTNI